jgi:hypothetical protein
MVTCGFALQILLAGYVLAPRSPLASQRFDKPQILLAGYVLAPHSPPSKSAI